MVDHLIVVPVSFTKERSCNSSESQKSTIPQRSAELLISAFTAPQCGRHRAAKARIFTLQYPRHPCRGKAPDPETAAKITCGSWHHACHGQFLGLPDMGTTASHLQTTRSCGRTGRHTTRGPPGHSEEPNWRPFPWQCQLPHRGARGSCPVLSGEASNVSLMESWLLTQGWRHQPAPRPAASYWGHDTTPRGLGACVVVLWAIKFIQKHEKKKHLIPFPHKINANAHRPHT
ncbi:hypothetical protein TcCL_ESM09280, partial [Trypanosoma cruzi]